MPGPKFEYVAPTQGVYEPSARVAESIVKGEATILVKPAIFGELKPGIYALVSQGGSGGIVRVGEGKTIESRSMFKSLEREHKISEEMLAEWQSVLPSWARGPWTYWPVEVLHKYETVRTVVQKSEGATLLIDGVLLSDSKGGYLIPGIEMSDRGVEVVAKIKDVANYDPSKLDDVVLRDDFRLCLAWFSTAAKDPDGFAYDQKTLEGLLEKIVAELVRRGQKTIQFDPANMKDQPRKFFTSVARRLKVPKEMYKTLEITKNMDLDTLNRNELVMTHWLLHKRFADLTEDGKEEFTTEDATNLHALVVDQLLKNGVTHLIHPGDDLDDCSSDFEASVESQPNYWVESSQALKADNEEVRNPDVDKVIALGVELSRLIEAGSVEETGSITKAASESAPSEDGKYRFVVHHHYRGKSCHADLRFEGGANNTLFDWVLNDQVPGSVKEPVVTLAMAKKQDGENGAFKIDWSTGEWATRPKTGTDKLVRAEIVAELQPSHPHAWLTVEGRTKDPVPGKPIPIGGTSQFPGVFNIVDKGQIEYGAQRSDMHEYFLHGKALNYRIFFRKLDMVSKAENTILPPSEGQGAVSASTWVCIYPDEQTPYVLNSDTVKKGWIPEAGRSALPAAIRSQIPDQFRYWTKGEKAREVRDALVAAMDKGEVKIDFSKPFASSKSTSLSTAAKSEDEFEMYFLVYTEKATSGSDRRLVTGIVLEPNVIDAQLDFEKPEVIERAAHRFVANYNRSSVDGGTIIGLMHQKFNNVGVELVESYIAPSDFHLGGSSKEKLVHKGSWVMTVHVLDDKLWKDVKDGKLTGFSVGGTVVTAGKSKG